MTDRTEKLPLEKWKTILDGSFRGAVLQQVANFYRKNIPTSEFWSRADFLLIYILVSQHYNLPVKEMFLI